MNQFIICQGFAKTGMYSVILGAVLNRVDMAGSGYYHRYYGKYSKYTKYYENEPAK